MRLGFLLIAIPLLLPQPAHAGVRAPSCDAIAAFGMRVDPIELTFGKPADAMTVDDFNQAIDIVTVCLDAAEAMQTETLHPWFRERRRNRIATYSTLAEDLKLHRSRARERERRAARNASGF